jgi:hypothetical protein
VARVLQFCDQDYHYSIFESANDNELGIVIKPVEDSFRKFIGAIEIDEEEWERKRAASFEHWYSEYGVKKIRCSWGILMVQ